ncbi:MAG: response regulator [Candidatus Omnitrophota bacterium]
MHKILIVDDERDLCEYVQRSLERTGLYKVRTTTFPLETCDLCRSFQPDIVLLDIIMPEMDGRQLIKDLQSDEQFQNIKIIVTSGLGEMSYSAEQDRWRWDPGRSDKDHFDHLPRQLNAETGSRYFNVEDFLAKPFAPQTLLNVIASHLQ